MKVKATVTLKLEYEADVDDFEGDPSEADSPRQFVASCVEEAIDEDLATLISEQGCAIIDKTVVVTSGDKGNDEEE